MSKKIAYSGILLGVNIILLLISNIVPVNTLFIMGLSSLPIAIIIMEFGGKSGILFYLASLSLSFIVLNNKFQWVLYGLTFGVYGLIKYIIEKNKNIYIEYILKIIFANIVIIATYFILKPFIYIPVNIFTIILFEIVFLVYDHVYTLFIGYYKNKLRKIIKRID